MNKLDAIDDKTFLFGMLFAAANKLDTLMDRELESFGLTSKQWFLSVGIDVMFDGPPTIKQVAKEMGSSHQNVKQVALKLEQKGLLRLEKDKDDARATRLVFTEKAREFWGGTQRKGEEFMEAVFKGIGGEDLAAARNVLQRVWNNLADIENE
jgi:DNA-binding MarR family transcriptional regulator